MSIIQEVKLTVGHWTVKAVRTSLDDKAVYYMFYNGKWLQTKAMALPVGSYAALRRALNKGEGMKVV